MSSKENSKTQEKKMKKKKSGKSDVKGKDETVKEDIVREESEADREGPPPTSAEKSEELELTQIDKEVRSAKDISTKQAALVETEVANKLEKKTKKENIVTSMDLEKLMQLKEAFSLFDFNHDGVIDLQDLKYTFASLGVPHFPEEEMQKMLKEAAEPVNFDSFVTLFGYKSSILDPEEIFTDALATWDMREMGMIPEERLKRDIRCFGDKFSGTETDCALEEAPVYLTEGVNMIDYIKFGSNVCGFRNLERTRKYQKKLEEEEARRYE